MAKSAEYKQQFKEEKKKRKTAYKNKRNAKIARFRFGKNLFIWFIGLITSWVLVAAIVLISLSVPLRTIAPVQTEQNPNGAISEKLGDKTILELFGAISGGNMGEFSMADFPVIVNSVDEIIQTSGVSNYVNIDKEKLSNLKFVYPDGELDANGNQKTFATELVSCIEITATIDSVAGDGVGDLNKISAFSENTELTAEESTEIKGYAEEIQNGKSLEEINAGSENKVFNPVMYCIEQTDTPQNEPMSAKKPNANSNFTSSDGKVYVRAFDNNGKYINGANASSTLYYRALTQVPILELTQIISDSFERIETDDIFKLANIDLESEENENGILNNLLGGKKISELGTITTADIKIADIFGEIEDDSLVKTLLVDLVNSGKVEEEKVLFEDISVDHLTAIGEDAVSSIKITTFLEAPTEENEHANQLIYDILIPATQPVLKDGETNYVNYGNGDEYWTAEDITVSSFSHMSIDNVKLSVLLEPPTKENEYANQLIYDILVPATRPEGVAEEDWTAEDITVSSFSHMSINNVKLSVLLEPPTEENEYANQLIYDILIPATKPTDHVGDWTAEDITVSSFSKMSIDNVKISAFLEPPTEENEYANQLIYDILIPATKPTDHVGDWTAEDITVSSFSKMSIDNIKLSVLLEVPTEENEYKNQMLYDIVVPATRPDGVLEEDWGPEDVIVGDLYKISTNNVKLGDVVTLDEELTKILVEISRPTLEAGEEDFANYGNGDTVWDANDLTIGSLSKINVNNLHLHVVLEDLDQDVKDILAQACGKDNFNFVTIDDLVYSFDVGNVMLTNIIKETADNQTMYDILALATKPELLPSEEDFANYGNGDKVWDEKDICVANLSKVNFDNVNLTLILTPNETNKKMFDILRELSGVASNSDITLNHLKSINIDNLSLTTVIEQNATNKKMFDILKELSGATLYSDIKISHLSSINIDNLSLTTVIEKTKDNETMFNILKELTNSTDYGDIKISHLASIDINDLKLTTILPKADNVKLYSILESVVTGLETDGEIRVRNLSGIEDFGGISLTDVLDVDKNATIYGILLQATKPLGATEWTEYDIKLEHLSNFDMGNITLEKVIPYDPGNTLCQILCEIYDKNESTYNTITVDNLSNFDLTNVKLSTVIKDAGDNKILTALLGSSTLENPVTIGNLGEKINSLSVYNLYGEDCWTTDVSLAQDSTMKYKKSVQEGKVIYELSNDGNCYVKKGAGIWLLVCFDVEEGDINAEGRSEKYTQSKTSFSDLSNGNNIASKFTGATLRQLKDAGIVIDVDENFDLSWTLQSVLSGQSGE